MPPERARKRKQVQDESEQPAQNKRSKVDEAPADDVASDHDSDPEPLPYQHLEQVNFDIPRHIIDATWSPLPPPAVDRITNMLQTVQRSVVIRLQDERKRGQASDAIDTLVRRVGRKIMRGLPFPPVSKKTRVKDDKEERAADFDFERVLDATREAEKKLTPALHSVELLKAEIRKEEALLEQETRALEKLERNAKSERARRRADAKTLHPALRQAESIKKEDDIVYAEAKPLALVEKDDDDEDLKPIIKELKGHLTSLETNFAQVEGIDEAIDQAHAALKMTLLKQVGEDKLKQILMG